MKAVFFDLSSDDFSYLSDFLSGSSLSPDDLNFRNSYFSNCSLPPDDFNYLTAYLFNCSLKYGSLNYNRHRLLRILKFMFDTKGELTDSQKLLYDKILDKMFEL